MTEPESVREVWRGRYLTLTVECWPESTEYEVLRKHHAVAIVPVTPNGDVLLVRQLRQPVRRELLEIPSGLLDVDGEDPEACATRELLEETGFRHETIEFLGGCLLSPGYTDEYQHLFMARTEERPTGEPEPGIELVRRPFSEIVTEARTGRIEDAKTALALLLADAHGAP